MRQPKFPTNARVLKFTATLWLDASTPLMTRQFDNEAIAHQWAQKFKHTYTVDLNIST